MGLAGGGFFGSGGKTSSTTTTNQQTGQSEITGPALAVNVSGGGKKSTTIVNALDGGAIQAGLDATREALAFADSVSARATDVFKAQTAASQSQVNAAYGLANAARQSETSGAINNFLKYGAIVVGLGIAAWAMRKAH